ILRSRAAVGAGADHLAAVHRRAHVRAAPRRAAPSRAGSRYGYGLPDCDPGDAVCACVHGGAAGGTVRRRRAARAANFHYLIACSETGEALAVDPLEWRLCLEAARKRGWQITQILNTHEHADHTGGNAGLKDATRAKIAAHAAAAARIGGVDRGLAKGDVLK